MSLERVLQAMFMCHRLPERSFFVRGRQLPLCARCSGILVGYLIGIVCLVYCGTPHWLWPFLLLAPLAVDGVGQYLGYWISNNPRRFASGILAGWGTVFLFVLLVRLGWLHGRMLAQMFS
ncbi:MAG TPA: DUF2085 domain-containing protein [Firmicutes bacterium]|jgi:uncharacterized membrane protein|nr:DUF2085 domain-containing protein [Bacillota bacterium]